MSLALKFVLIPLLLTQAAVTRKRLPRLPEADGPRAGVEGEPAAPGLIRLLIAGDSSAAGVGVATQTDALALPLSQRLAQHTGSRVAWHLAAKSGLNTAETWKLLQAEALPPADVAVVCTGVNDIIEQVPTYRAVAHREGLANWLRNARGVQHVVFAPLPPVHQFPGLPQPLRWIAGTDARRHNAAIRDWVRTRGDVSCVAMQVPLNRGVMAEDGFHPGEPVYRYSANTIAEHIATRVWPTLHRGATA